MDKIKLDVISHGDLTSQPWEEQWDTIHDLAEAVREGVIDPDSRVEGKLRVSVACKSEVKRVNERFASMNVEVDEEVQQFEDREVLKMFLRNDSPISKTAFGTITSLSLQGKTGIKSFNELKDTAITNLGTTWDCSLEEADFEKITTLPNGALSGAFHSVGATGVLFCPNVKSANGSWASQNGSILSSRCTAKAWFLPRFEECGYILNGTTYGYGNNTVELIDVGQKWHKTTNQGGFGNTNFKLTFVCRSRSFTSLHNSYQIVSNVKCVYVPAGMIDQYKAWFTGSSVIYYEIGGPEWIAEFGSADEYADIDKYVTDPAEREKIRAAYAAN